MADCVVVGAGPAGLAAAALLARRGVRAAVLERGDGPGAAWTERYDRLRINTSSYASRLPGRPLPLRAGRWPTRDELVAYYRDYARRRQLDVRPGVAVERIERGDAGWVVRTAAGELRARAVVVATGKGRVPRRPGWRGRDRFAGELLHAADYRRPEPFASRRVLVVGAGSSAVDIALDLVDAGAAAVWLSIRTPPHLARRAVAGVPADLIAIAASPLPRRAIDALARRVRRLSLGDLAPHGLPEPSDGLTERVLERGMIPTIDPGPFARLLRDGAIRIVPAVEGLTERGAALAGGGELAVDAVIAATGYACGLEPLVGHLDVLDGDGLPLAPPGAALAHAPGLHFLGFRDVLTGNLRQIRLDARAVAAAIV